MGNSDSKGEIIVKCSLEEMVKHFFKDYAVIWHDPNVNSPENQHYIMQLKNFCDVLTFTEWEKALASIQECKAACHVITSGTNGEVFVEEIFEISNVVKIYVFCMNKEYHSTWAQRYQKVSCVETNIQNLINQIKQNLLEWYREMSSLKVNLPAFAPIFNDGDKSEMNHLHRFLKMISSFENRAQAKSDLLSLSRLIYTDENNTNHIAAFDKHYNKYDKKEILRWYTRESFLYKVANNCLRIATSDSIQYCRLLLKDLEQAIKDQYKTKSKGFNGLLYRGAYLSKEEWTSLKENQDKEIEMHGFLSVSKEKSVALNFMQTSSSQKVLISILVPKGPRDEEQGFAEIEEFSLFPAEREILFNVRSRFTVLETEDEYSPELPYRHLVLLYGAQGLRKYSAEKNPYLKLPVSKAVKMACSHCTQGMPADFLFRLLDKTVYYCKNCIEHAGSPILLITPIKKAPAAKEITVKGCFLMNNFDQLKIPFYGYKCSQCQAQRQKSYFLCTDCSTDNKLTWCENCFTESLSCIQAQHNILLETRPFTFWCEKMSANELAHLRYQNRIISENDNFLWKQADMYRQSHQIDKAIEYYNLYLECNQTETLGFYNTHALLALGSLYRSKKNYAKALECDFKALEFSKSFLGIYRDVIALSESSIGEDFTMLKDYAKALEYYLKALSTYKFFMMKDKIANTYNDIGYVYQLQKDYNKALEYYFNSLEISKTLHGETHQSVANSYCNIGGVLKELKEYAKALENYFKALEIEKLLYGENHLNIAATYKRIADVLQDQKEDDKAFEYYVKSLEIRKLLYGENHSDVAISYQKIAEAYFEQEEYVKALELFLKVLEIRKLLYGENSPQVAMCYYNIGLIYTHQNEYINALEYHLKSLEIRKLLYGEKHPDTALSYSEIALAFEGQGEYNKALEYQLKSLEIRKSLYGENHSDVALSYQEIGYVYLEQKEYTKALEYYSRSLEMKRLFYEENTNDIAVCYSGIGVALNNQGEYNTALEHHEKALSIRRTIFGENDSYTAMSYDRIADVYMNQKEYAKALEYCQKCLEIRDSVLGKGHRETVQSQNKLLEIKSALS